jgi:hypothetical protein
MCIVNPTAEHTKVLSIPVPVDFYKPGSLWKIKIVGRSNPANNGIRISRRLVFGAWAVSELFGTTFGSNYDMVFQDSHDVMMYGDNLFDVVSSGINSLSPVMSEVQGAAVPVPFCSRADSVASHSFNPSPDRTGPIDLMLWVGPVSSQKVVYIEQLSIIRME